jgi:hypothetical protein
MNLHDISLRSVAIDEEESCLMRARVCSCRVAADWQARFGYPPWLIVTFDDPRRFSGIGYRAANWLEVGTTRGYRRTRAGYSHLAETPRHAWSRPPSKNSPAKSAASSITARG